MNSSTELSHNHSCTDGEHNRGFQYSVTENFISVSLQIVGWFLILSTALMFLKHPVLRKAENVFHVNILVCSLFLLFVDWYILELGEPGCEIFTLSLLLFGAAGTFSTVCIAIERYKRMVHMTIITNRQYFIWMCMIWLTSLLLILYPSWTTVVEMSKGFTSTSEQTMRVTCFFTDSYLYTSLHYSVFFLCLVVIMPVAVKMFCYVKVYQHVRKASMNRWFRNAAAQCSQRTRVIQPTERKGNIIQLTKGQPRFEQRQTLASRDRSILFKGIISVCLVLFCWLPFASCWIQISSYGFSEKSPKQLLYLILLAKMSAVLSISHYTSLNSKFRKYYFKSTFGRLLQTVNCATVGISPEENTSQGNSNTVISRVNISKASKGILPIQPARQFQLEPINELHA